MSSGFSGSPPCTQLGICFYNVPGQSEPHWTLVAHPQGDVSFYDARARVYEIRPTGSLNPLEAWRRRSFDAYLTQEPLGSIIGIFKLSSHPIHMTAIEQIVDRLPTARAGDNPAGVDLWGPAGWVVRILHHMQMYFSGLNLPDAKDIHKAAWNASRQLPAARGPAGTPFPIM